ncbi:MAG: MBL fold metallo-hydrolase, partial [Thermoplasmatales archaeon]|nr:MBL fold metallo-hydrolase [Thermoplasmatales archaeon]
LSIISTSSFHSDPTTVGFKIKTKNGIISYISDTELQQKIVDEHRDARILILCVTRPLKSRIKWHICTEDAAEIIGKIKPELAVITHFGMKILEEDPKYQAGWIQKNTGIKTIAAEDGMRIKIGEGIEVM